MSIFQSKSDRKKWTTTEVKLMIGLKLLGVEDKHIAVACAHPIGSVVYKWGAVKRSYEGNEDALLKELGVESADELKEYAEAEIARMSGDDGAA